MKGIVVIPTFNERSNIARLVREIFQLVPELHILVVDDNSPDGTARVVTDLQDEFQNLHLLQRTACRSFGKSYIDGMKQALAMGAELILQMDADYSHNPRYILKFLEVIQHCDLAIGSRYMNGVSVVNWPIRRLVLSVGANTYVRWITGLKVLDATSGYKCWRREVLEAMDLDSIHSDGYAFQIEIIYQASQLGFQLQEVPIIFIDRTSGTSKISRNMVREAMLLPWKLWLRALASGIVSVMAGALDWLRPSQVHYKAHRPLR